MKNWISKTVAIAVFAWAWVALHDQLSGQTPSLPSYSNELSQQLTQVIPDHIHGETVASSLGLSNPIRNYGGWSAASVHDQSPNGSGRHQEEQTVLPFTVSEPVVYASYFQSSGYEGSPSLPSPQFANFQVPNPQGISGQVPNPQLPGQQYTNPQYASSLPPNSQPSIPAHATSGLRLRNEGDGNLHESSPVLPHSYAQQFTTGLPFVTPAPGRYPTSPYMGPRNVPIYQSVGFQRVVPAIAGGGASGAAMTDHLPQYGSPQFQTTAYQSPSFSSNPTPGFYSTGYQQCQVLPPPSLPPDGAIGQSYIPPTITPNMTPGMYSANNMGFRPLFSLGQENYNVVLGRGIIGQPTAYVPGQFVRNFLRYLSP